jgi:hypothetical protein
LAFRFLDEFNWWLSIHQFCGFGCAAVWRSPSRSKTIFGIAIDIKHTLECIDPTAAISARLDVFS